MSRPDEIDAVIVATTTLRVVFPLFIENEARA